MFDLIIAYLVIMFLVNTAKSAKEQQKKGAGQQKNNSSGTQKGKYAPYGNKRYPAKKQETPQPAGTAARPVVIFSEEQRAKKPQSETARKTAPAKEVKKAPSIKSGTAVASGERESLSSVLEPTEENILTGLVWSEILGPPVSKRPRRY